MGSEPLTDVWERVSSRPGGEGGGAQMWLKCGCFWGDDTAAVAASLCVCVDFGTVNQFVTS